MTSTDLQDDNRDISPTSSINSEDAVCDCSDKDPATNLASQKRNDYFICCRCALLQHYKCHLADPAEEETLTLRYRCNPCRATTMEAFEMAVTDRNERIQAYSDAIDRKHEELQKVVMQLLWRQYCLLPGSDAPAAVKEACTLKYEGGRMVPKKPAPAGWDGEIQANLEKLMGACGKKLVDLAKEPSSAAEDMNVRVLVPLREFAMQLLHRAAWRGKRRRLGVLGEVLGFEEKGTVWKG